MMLKTINDFFANRVPLVFDGAMGTELQKRGIDIQKTGARCFEEINLIDPESILAIHQDYLQAGANVVETNTFGANRIKLAEYGIDKKVYDINKAAVEIARKAIAGSTIKQPAFVCGSIGPTGQLPSLDEPGLNKLGFDALAQVFEEQAKGLIEGGCDLLVIETGQDLIEMRAAISGIKRSFIKLKKKIPLGVQATMDASGKMLLGSDVHAFLGAVINLNIEFIGLNCSTGPAEMKTHIERLLALSPVPVSMIPNAGMPENIDGKAVYTMKAEPFASVLSELVEKKG